MNKLSKNKNQEHVNISKQIINEKENYQKKLKKRPKQKNFNGNKIGQKNNYNKIKISKRNKTLEAPSKNTNDKVSSNNKKKLKENNNRYFGKVINNNSNKLNKIIPMLKNSHKNLQYKKKFTFEFLDSLNFNLLKKPKYVLEYRKEIITTYIKDENKYVPDYLELNGILQKNKRIQYISFLLKICDKLSDEPTVTYLCINIFDRTLCKLKEKNKIITDKLLQLISLTSIFISFKYEEGFFFDLNDIIENINEITFIVTKQEVLKFEIEVAEMLDYNFLIIYPNHFVLHFILIDLYDYLGDEEVEKVYCICLFFMDFLLYNTELMKNKISLISSSCYFIAINMIFKKENIWTNILQFFTGCSFNEVYDLSLKIITTFNEFCGKGVSSKFNALAIEVLKRKYSRKKYHGILEIFERKI